MAAVLLAASGPFLYDQVMSLLRLLRADDTDQRGGIAIMLRRRRSLGRTSSETRIFSIVLPFYISGGDGLTLWCFRGLISPLPFRLE